MAPSAFRDPVDDDLLHPDAFEHIGVVPPRRLGSLLSSERVRRGLTIEEISEASAGRLPLHRLSSIERGTARLDDHELALVIDLYGVAPASLVPERSQLMIDLDEGLLWVNETSNRTRVRASAGREDVLSRYLSMVYSMRHIEPGTPVSLRVDDVDVLGRALRAGTDTIIADLDSLMNHTNGPVSWRLHMLKSRVMVPAAGVLVAFCAAGALLLVQGNASPASAEVPSPGTPTSITAPATPPAAAPVSVGTAVVQERNADGTPGPVQPR